MEVLIGNVDYREVGFSRDGKVEIHFYYNSQTAQLFLTFLKNNNYEI